MAPPGVRLPPESAISSGLTLKHFAVLDSAGLLTRCIRPSAGCSSAAKRAGALGVLLREVLLPVSQPRDLTYLVTADVRAAAATAVATLEQHGPVITEALRQLDQATTAAWNALRSAAPTDDEWRLVQRVTGISRGWEAAYRLVSTLDPPGQGLRAD